MNTKDEWQDIFSSFDPSSCQLAGGVAEDEIESFEADTGYVLPEDYRSFVQQYGCGSIGSTEILGLGVKPTGIPSLAWLLRELDKLGLTPPVGVLPVSPLGDGTYAAILAKPKGAFAQGTIIRWTPGSSERRVDVLGSSFAAYLKEAVSKSQ